MDMILTIFTSLGVDKTVFIQAGILVIIFLIVSTLLFSKLQEVLELREDKTTKLEGNAHAIYKQADELAEQYKARIEKTHQESQLGNQKKKAEIASSEREKIKSAEEQFSKEYEEKRIKILDEVSVQKVSLFSKVNELSGSLVEKLTK